MKKITRFGYIINKATLADNQLKTLKEDLTAKPFSLGSYSKFNKSKNFPLYKENGDWISIPKYYGMEKFGEPDINRLEDYKFPQFNMKYTGTLRPNQQIIVDKIEKGFKKHGGGILISGCGSGKTNMAIYLACKYKLKTLFVVHKTFLKNQFINRVKSVTNVKKVGVIQRKTVKTDSPFVVGMIQSLSKIDYDDKIFKDFGLIIIDEVHHMGAKNFSNLFRKMTTKYMLGITANKERNDGMYKIINMYMGPVLHFEEQKPNDMVVVKKLRFKTFNKKRIKPIINKYTGEPDRSSMISNLVHIKRRNRIFYKMIKILFEEGKNILFLTGRLKQINLFYRLLKENIYTRDHVGKYIGGMSEEELAIAATKQIILGTFNTAEEGLDIENLNVVILAGPKSSIKQSVGRILRKDVYEEHPIVIDMVDEKVEIFKNQYKVREKYYNKQNYNIQELKIADYQTKGYVEWDDVDSLKAFLAKTPDKKPNGKFFNKKIEKDKFIKMNYDEIDFLDD